ncbi:MAG: Trk system potassium transporter TrkA [Flavobacteriaceae bacterium]|jgi:trk system potassium uptake protein TrkA|nr:Trk system potassium transporter TrkA [Flavobacteriaceae bacterium]MBT6448060.1 Trk system potassium transporter TrkA [Flavobacteriaceae bacterium]
MKIIIAGAGEVGFHLAKLLSFESQDITLIDNKKSNLNIAEHQLDIKTIEGNSASISVLKEANVDKSDLVVSLTSSETTNFSTCFLAKQLGAKRTIARISNSEFINSDHDIDFNSIGIDELISPENLATEEIKLLIHESAFTNIHAFEEGILKMMGVKLEKKAPFVGKTVMEAASVFPGVHFMPIALKKEGTEKTIIPRGDTVFCDGDQVYFITDKKGLQELYNLLGTVKQNIDNIMILGAGRIGSKLARDLSNEGLNVKIIEINEEKANNLAEELSDVMMINVDGRNVDLLVEENLENMDAFIATTGNSETNIMSCLMAKSKKIKKTIALVDNMDYFNLSQSIGIDTLINKKLLAANDIFRFVRNGDIVELAKLNNMDAEIVEFNVSNKSKVLNKKIVDLNFPREAIIGGVIRGDKGIIALGDFVIQYGDRVLVCSTPEVLSKVESLFL